MNSLRQKYTRTEFMEVAKIRLSEKNDKAMKWFKKRKDLEEMVDKIGNSQ